MYISPTQTPFVQLLHISAHGSIRFPVLRFRQPLGPPSLQVNTGAHCSAAPPHSAVRSARSSSVTQRKLKPSLPWPPCLSPTSTSERGACLSFLALLSDWSTSLCVFKTKVLSLWELVNVRLTPAAIQTAMSTMLFGQKRATTWI